MDRSVVGEEKVMGFIENLRQQEAREANERALKNSLPYKRNVIKAEKEKAKECCYKKIFNDMYRNAVPLSNEYKSAYGPEMNGEFSTFVTSYYPDKDLSYVVNEGVKKKNPIMCRLSDKVNKFVNESFGEKERNIASINVDDIPMVFTEEDEQELKKISDDMEFNDISKVVKDNVKNNVKGEITATKNQKEDSKKFEESLKNDNNIKTESALNRAILRSGKTSYMESGMVYQPSLFESIMVSKMRNAYSDTVMESVGETPSYGFRVDDPLKGLREETVSEGVEDVLTEDALNGETIATDPMKDYVMVESVKEYTCLNILKALKLENFNPLYTSRLANKYASGK